MSDLSDGNFIQPHEVKKPEPYKTPLTLSVVVMKYDPLEVPDIQAHIRPILDALNSVPNFVRGEAFVMSVDNHRIDSNEVKLVLEFETK